MKRRYKVLLAVILALACVGAGVFYALQPVAVSTETVLAGDLTRTFTEQATVVPETSIVLNASATGTVGELPFAPGEAVRAGQTLLQIDSSTADDELQNRIKTLQLQQNQLYAQNGGTQAGIELQTEQLRQQLDTAKQQYEQLFGEEGNNGTATALADIAESTYAQARRAYKEAKDAYEGNGTVTGPEINSTELSALRTQMDVAAQNLAMAQSDSSALTKSYYESLIASSEAQLALQEGSGAYTKNATYAAAQQLQVTIDELKSKLERGAVVAPADGILWELPVETGEYVVENAPVARLYYGKLYLEAGLLAEDALAVRVGDTVRCSFADGGAAQARVSFISPVAVEQVSSIGLTESRVTVKLELAEGLPGAVGAGYRADAAFTLTAAQDVLSVPVSCVFPEGDGSAVYVAREGVATLVPVAAGQEYGGRVEITSGLAAGDAVILDPAGSSVRAGMRVAAE